MTPRQNDLDDLEVLERVLAAQNTPVLRGRQPAPANFMGLLEFSVNETTRYARALKRLIDRQILSIAHVSNMWALSIVGGRGESERDRLRAATTDPADLLRECTEKLHTLGARLHAGVEDPDPLVAEAERVVSLARAAVEGMLAQPPGRGRP